MSPWIAALLLPLAAPTVAILQVHSRAFAPDGTLPAAYLCRADAPPPPIAWSAPPEGTRSLLVVIDDPAPRRSFVHWVVYNVPPTVRELDGLLPSGASVGLSSNGRPGWVTPCPEGPSRMHFYRFKVYALDVVLPSFAVPADERVITSMSGHILGAGEMVGSWVH
jgi:Raf kinase inhibitor-like YbhB/YbcL family protein